MPWLWETCWNTVPIVPKLVGYDPLRMGGEESPGSHYWWVGGRETLSWFIIKNWKWLFYTFLLCLRLGACQHHHPWRLALAEVNCGGIVSFPQAVRFWESGCSIVLEFGASMVKVSIFVVCCLQKVMPSEQLVQELSGACASSGQWQECHLFRCIEHCMLVGIEKPPWSIISLSASSWAEPS